jgi:hypothetical protein
VRCPPEMALMAMEWKADRDAALGPPAKNSAS